MKLTLDLHNFLVPGKIEFSFKASDDGQDPIEDIKMFDLVMLDELKSKFEINELIILNPQN